MAKIVEQVERDGDVINIYESGAQYNVTKKKLIYPASNTLITGENATAYNRRRQELARAEFIAGANEAVEHLKPDLMPLSGDLAYVRAIGYATQQKAMAPKDPKQTDAARLALNVGERIGDSSQPTTQNNTINVIALPDEVVQLFADLKRRLHAESVISASNPSRQAVRVVDAYDGSPTGQDEAE